MSDMAEYCDRKDEVVNYNGDLEGSTWPIIICVRQNPSRLKFRNHDFGQENQIRCVECIASELVIGAPESTGRNSNMAQKSEYDAYCVSRAEQMFHFILDSQADDLCGNPTHASLVNYWATGVLILGPDRRDFWGGYNELIFLLYFLGRRQATFWR